MPHARAADCRLNLVVVGIDIPRAQHSELGPPRRRGAQQRRCNQDPEYYAGANASSVAGARGTLDMKQKARGTSPPTDLAARCQQGCRTRCAGGPATRSVFPAPPRPAAAQPPSLAASQLRPRPAPPVPGPQQPRLLPCAGPRCRDSVRLREAAAHDSARHALQPPREPTSGAPAQTGRNSQLMPGSLGGSTNSALH